MTKASPLTRTVTFHARAGAEGLEILAFGLHVPGDGEMVAGLPDHA